jgi:hypothetical protein
VLLFRFYYYYSPSFFFQLQLYFRSFSLYFENYVFDPTKQGIPTENHFILVIARSQHICCMTMYADKITCALIVM